MRGIKDYDRRGRYENPDEDDIDPELPDRDPDDISPKEMDAAEVAAGLRDPE